METLKLIKNKRAQAMLEFCMCIPVVLLMTLGVMDVAKMAIIKMENTQALQAYVSIAAASRGTDSSGRVINTGVEIKSAVSRYIQETAMFCTHVEGLSSPGCAYKAKNVVQTSIRMEKVDDGALAAGKQICMASKSEFKPHYSGVFSGGTAKVYTRVCTIMETSRNDSIGWSRLAKGAW